MLAAKPNHFSNANLGFSLLVPLIRSLILQLHVVEKRCEVRIHFIIVIVIVIV